MDRYPEKQAVYSVDKPFRQTSLDLRHNATNWQPTRDFTRCVTLYRVVYDEEPWRGEWHHVTMISPSLFTWMEIC